MIDNEILESNDENMNLDASPYPDRLVFTFYDDGKVKSIAGMKDGKKHGIYYRVMTNGKIYEIILYNAGIRQNLF